MISRLNANPSYGVIEEEDDAEPVYELVDQCQREHQYRNISTVGNNRRIVRSIRCLCCMVVILGALALLAMLTAVGAVTLTLLLNKAPASTTTDSNASTEKGEWLNLL